MEVIIKRDYDEMSKEAAGIIKAALLKKPNLVLGLATGNTPIGLYNELARMHREEGLDFSQVVTFNLDEYVGLLVSHPQSFHSFMERHLFSKINIPPSNRFIPQTALEDHENFCAWYEQQIRRYGGIDIQVLGIGTDGHIAFNEPSSSLGSRTRIKSLHPSTREANAQNFGGDVEAVPKLAITMGVGTIMEANRCLLLANGEAKAEAIARCVEGPITAEIPASALQTHPKATILIDEAAASKLKRVDYYKWVYENKLEIEKAGRQRENK
jgi:glucosamine-6-phosphate deaminase